MEFFNKKNNIEVNTEFLEEVLKTGTKALFKGISSSKTTLGARNYKLNAETGEVELTGIFSKEILENVKILICKDEEDNEIIEFLRLTVTPVTRFPIVTDFTTNKKSIKDKDMDELIEFSKLYDFKPARDKFLFANILGKEIIDINTLYPVIISSYGDKTNYTAEEVKDTINKLKKNVADKNKLEKKAIKVKVVRKNKTN